MRLYDGVIADARALFSDMAPRRWDYASADAWRESDESELVLQRDAAFELGGGGCPSANLTCVTSDETLVPKNETLLYGADLVEVRGDVPFARLAFLLSDGLDGDDEAAYRAIRKMEFVKYHVFPEGYMVRVSSESNREQVRVNRAALARGVNFRAVGAAYIRGYLKAAHVRRAQLVFVTGGAAVSQLAALARKTNDITKTLTHILEGLPADCGSCSLKPVCDEVEGMREMHFGRKGKG